MRTACKWLVLVVALLGLHDGQAWAHKVNVFAYVEGGKIFTESYFPDGKKIEGGTIEVRDASGTKLLVSSQH